MKYKYSLCFRTCERTNSYIYRTLESLLHSNLPESVDVFVFCDKNNEFIQPLVECFPEIKFISSNKYLNPNENGLFSLSVKTNSDYFFVCEDDILFSKNFIEYVDYFLQTKNYTPDDNNILSLYTPYSEVKDCYDKKEDMWEYPLEKYYGTQCMLINQKWYKLMFEIMNHYLNSPEDFTWIYDKLTTVGIKEKRKFKNFDLWLKNIFAYFCKDIQNFTAIVPCMVEHNGSYSSIQGRENKGHKSFSFMGEDFDANILKEYFKKG